MGTFAASLLLVWAGVTGAAAHAAAEPVRNPAVVAPGDDDDSGSAPTDAPKRPGGGVHYPRNSTKLDREETDDTAPGADAVDGTLDSAGIAH